MLLLAIAVLISRITSKRIVVVLRIASLHGSAL
jgi:hypothetical protein